MTQPSQGMRVNAPEKLPAPPNKDAVWSPYVSYPNYLPAMSHGPLPELHPADARRISTEKFQQETLGDSSRREKPDDDFVRAKLPRNRFQRLSVFGDIESTTLAPGANIPPEKIPESKLYKPNRLTSKLSDLREFGYDLLVKSRQTTSDIAIRGIELAIIASKDRLQEIRRGKIENKNLNIPKIQALDLTENKAKSKTPELSDQGKEYVAALEDARAELMPKYNKVVAEAKQSGASSDELASIKQEFTERAKQTAREKLSRGSSES